MNNLNIKALKLAAAFLITISFISCKKDFFESVDHGALDARIWDNEGAVQFSLNKTYDLIMPEFPYENTQFNMFFASDEDRFSGIDANMKKVLGITGLISSGDVKFIGSKYQGNNNGDNKYFDIARCNDAILNIPLGTIPDDAKRKLKGQFHALRAIAYFDLVRLYGGVPLVLEPQDPNNITLEGRKSASACFKAIVNDLDSAMVLLNGVVWNDGTERGKITKMAAAALKARVLLYAASPQFNPEGYNHGDVDPKWKTAFAANKEAYELCALSRSLMTNYAEIFLKEGPSNTEAIVVRSYSSTLQKRFNTVELKARPTEEGGKATGFLPTWNLVQAYLMDDGMPASTNPNYDPIQFWKNRDPRLEASIAYNGSSYKLSGNANRRQWSYTGALSGAGGSPFYSKRFTSPDLAKTSVDQVNEAGGNGMDWIDLRFAEVILNYAECANETGNLTLAKQMVELIRVRAKIKKGNFNYGLDLATDKPSMRKLIINERMIEFALEGKRFHDLRRTRTMHLLQGSLETMTIDVKSPAEKTFLETVNSQGVLNRDTVNINNKTVFNRFFTITTGAIPNLGSFAFPEFNYFYALPSSFMNSSPLLEQTIGWDGGTFDPLKD